MNELISKDQELLLFLNGLGSPAFDSFWILMTGKWFWVPFYVILFYFIYKSFPAKKLIFILIFIALGITVSDQLAGVFKIGIARLRPCHEPLMLEQMRMVVCGGQYGFYSSHSSNSFFLVSFLSILIGKKYKFLPYILVIWAILVSYSRIYLGVHYPLDITFGAAVGFLLGGIFANLVKKVLYRNQSL